MVMRKHPLPELIRYVVWLLVIATTHHPVVLLLCLLTVWRIRGRNFWKGIPLDILMVGITVGVNVLTNHRGETYLFYLNDNVVTLESIVYGSILGLQIVLLIHISVLFSRRMTADKLVIVTGVLSPAIAILLSMAIRNVERYRQKIREIYCYQKCESCSESIWERFFVSIRTVSILVNWALENGLEVSDSMIARGYQSGRRSSYSPVRFLGQDLVECIFLLLFAGVWEWGQPLIIISPYIKIGDCGWWMVLTVGYLVYILAEEKYEDQYQEKNNIRTGNSTRYLSGDW